MKFGVKHILGAVAGLAMAGLASAASATPVTYNLTLLPGYGPGGMGSFTVEGPVTPFGHYSVLDGTLLNLEFDIDGHAFDLSDSNFANSTVDFFAGVLSNIAYNAGDFWVNFTSLGLGYTYNQTDLIHGDFTYSGGLILAISSGSNDVPEPLTLALVGAGLAGMGAMRKRKAA